MSDAAGLFLEFSRMKLSTQYWPRLRTCAESLTDEQIWWRPNAACNSVGNLMLHLNGNMRQWLVNSFNRQPDLRDRPTEFAADGSVSGAALIEKLGATVEEGLKVLGRLTEEELLAHYEIQGFHVTGLAAVYQVIEHFGLHYGQIAYVTKMLTDKDLGFYQDLSKTGRSANPQGSV
ncbi:MAG: DUF1572 family protein [Acidobacteriaceae bacterium]